MPLFTEFWLFLPLIDNNGAVTRWWSPSVLRPAKETFLILCIMSIHCVPSWRRISAEISHMMTVAKKTCCLDLMLQLSREANGARCWACCLRTSYKVDPSTRWVRPEILLLCSVMSLHRAYLVMSSLSSVCLQASQFSKHSSASDRSHLKARSGASSSSFDLYVEEAREVVLTASGQPLGSDRPDAESSALGNDDARLLLDLISGSFGTRILQVTLVSRASAVICSCRFLPRRFSAVWWTLAIRGSAVCIRICRGHSSAYERERSMKIFALCALLSALTVAHYTFLIPGVVQAKAGLLGEPSGDHRWHAGHPRQLDGGSRSGIQAALRDAAPLCQLRGPLPLPDDEH